MQEMGRNQLEKFNYCYVDFISIALINSYFKLKRLFILYNYHGWAKIYPMDQLLPREGRAWRREMELCPLRYTDVDVADDVADDSILLKEKLSKMS